MRGAELEGSVISNGKSSMREHPEIPSRQKTLFRYMAGPDIGRRLKEGAGCGPFGSTLRVEDRC
jgi:hypothetical protein